MVQSWVRMLDEQLQSRKWSYSFVDILSFYSCPKKAPDSNKCIITYAFVECPNQPVPFGESKPNEVRSTLIR